MPLQVLSFMAAGLPALEIQLPGYVKYSSRSILILFSLLIGFSRIYLRVHYASDVIAGFCCGFAWLCLTIYLMEQN
jgi:undecaprenyl-diphosphatase